MTRRRIMKTEKRDFYYFGKELMNKAFDLLDKKQPVSFEEIVIEVSEKAYEMSESEILEKIGKFYCFDEISFIPNPAKMLARYVEIAEYNDIDEGTDLDDVRNKALSIRELLRGYIYEASMLHFCQMEDEGANIYNISKSDEISPLGMAATIYNLIAFAPINFLKGNISKKELEKLHKKIYELQ